MTTLQKIKSLTWWNEIAKLKSILTDLLNSSGGGGGSQDLQSVLDNGYSAIDGYIEVKTVDYLTFSCMSPDQMGTYSTTLGGITLRNHIEFSQPLGSGIGIHRNAILKSSPIDDNDNDNRIFTLPLKSSGTYILSTTRDMYPIYANDAAADVALTSGALYKITGSRAVYQKP